jgi:hypothetical protein
MGKRIFVGVMMMVAFLQIHAQDIWYTRNGNISFHAGTSLEDIDGVNNDVASMINTKTGEIAFTVLIKSFHFKRALMEEHFNENYMESTTIPKATFTGIIADAAQVNFSKEGNYPVTVEGQLTIHGVSRKVSAPGTITISGGKLSTMAGFTVLLSDYKISVPGVVADKISKEAKVEVKCNYEKKN